MKKVIYTIIIGLFAVVTVQQATAEQSLASRLAGRFLLQVEESGRIWWTNPESLKRIEMTRENFYDVMRAEALGITNEDLALIPTNDAKSPSTASQSQPGDNRDTDGDGIEDRYDSYPNGDPPIINKVYKVEIDRGTVVMHIDIPYDRYDYYKQHNSHYFTYNPTNLKDFLTPNDPVIQDIIDDTREFTDDEIEQVLILIKLAYEMYYTDDKYTGADEYPKYPLETIIEGTGDCEDTSFLVATLLKALGIYPIALVEYPFHVAVGIETEGVVSDDLVYQNGKEYMFIETTDDTIRIGDMPYNLKGYDYIIHEIY